MAAPVIEPMLAVYGLPTGSLDGWAAEPKLDGWRALVTVAPRRGVRVRSCREHDLTVPELAPLADLGVDLVLDGHLVAGGGRMDDFYDLAAELARQRRVPLTFVAFDVLWLADQVLIDCSYDQRRSILEAMSELDLGAPISVVSSWPGEDADPLLTACEAEGVEGVVLKRRSATYTPGRRTTDWRQVKCASWREVHADRRRPR